MNKANLSLLVVDDDDFYATLIMEYLNEKGYSDIRYARTGVECMLEVFEERVPDIVILDYQLVNLDGLRIMERLLNYHEDMKVIIISNQQDMKVAIDAMKKGALDYLVKNDDLFRKLGSVIDQNSNTKPDAGIKEKLKNLLSHTKNIYFETFLGISNS